MIETMNTFLQAVKEREHIHPLIQQADLRVSLLCDQHQPIHLVIKNGEIVTLLDSESTEQPRSARDYDERDATRKANSNVKK